MSGAEKDRVLERWAEEVRAGCAAAKWSSLPDAPEGIAEIELHPEDVHKVLVRARMGEESIALDAGNSIGAHWMVAAVAARHGNPLPRETLLRDIGEQVRVATELMEEIQAMPLPPMESLEEHGLRLGAALARVVGVTHGEGLLADEDLKLIRGVAEMFGMSAEEFDRAAGTGAPDPMTGKAEVLGWLRSVRDACDTVPRPVPLPDVPPGVAARIEAAELEPSSLSLVSVALKHGGRILFEAAHYIAAQWIVGSVLDRQGYSDERERLVRKLRSENQGAGGAAAEGGD